MAYHFCSKIAYLSSSHGSFHWNHLSANECSEYYNNNPLCHLFLDAIKVLLGWLGVRSICNKRTKLKFIVFNSKIKSEFDILDQTCRVPVPLVTSRLLIPWEHTYLPSFMLLFKTKTNFGNQIKSRRQTNHQAWNNFYKYIRRPTVHLVFGLTWLLQLFASFSIPN